MKKTLFAMLLTSQLIAQNTSVDTLKEESLRSEKSTKALNLGSSSFLIAPIPFSNPTLGSGINLIGLYMHAKRDEDSLVPTTGLIGLYSSNKSWMTGIFHEDFWDNNNNRIKAGLATSQLNLKYYGIGRDEGDQEPIDYHMYMLPFFIQYQRKISSSSHWYFGPQYLLLTGKIEDSQNQLNTSTLDGEYTASAIGLVASYDTRDENYFPTSGIYSESVIHHFNEKIGSDFNSNFFKTSIINYYPHAQGSTFAIKAEYKYNSSTKPFFLLPSISLRGFDRTKYLDQMVFQVQSEERYRFKKRFVAVAFLEGGIYGSSFNDLNQDSFVMSYGAGIRYQITKEQKINLAVDFAFSQSDSAVYLRLGEAF